LHVFDPIRDVGPAIPPAEGLEVVAVIEAQRAVVEKLRPTAMHREPTPEELVKQKNGISWRRKLGSGVVSNSE